MLHLDVMDGHFVPNITLGPVVVSAVRKVTDLHLDVHLMIEDPDRYLEAFAEAGANSISVHQETCRHLDRTLNSIRQLGVMAGVVINPATPVSLLEDVTEVMDYVLVMSVNPGFGGQKFIPRSIDKVHRLAAWRRQTGLDYKIQIDGGITLQNVGAVAQAGADWVVAGSSIFGTADPGATVRDMQQRAREAVAVRV